MAWNIEWWKKRWRKKKKHSKDTKILRSRSRFSIYLQCILSCRNTTVVMHLTGFEYAYLYNVKWREKKHLWKEKNNDEGEGLQRPTRSRLDPATAATSRCSITDLEIALSINNTQFSSRTMEFLGVPWPQHEAILLWPIVTRNTNAFISFFGYTRSINY